MADAGFRLFFIDGNRTESKTRVLDGKRNVLELEKRKSNNAIRLVGFLKAVGNNSLFLVPVKHKWELICYE